MGCRYPTRAIDLLSEDPTQCIPAAGIEDLDTAYHHDDHRDGDHDGLQFTIHALSLIRVRMPGPFPRGVRLPFHAVSHIPVPAVRLDIYLLVFIASLDYAGEPLVISSAMPSGHWGDLLGAGHPHFPNPPVPEHGGELVDTMPIGKGRVLSGAETRM